MARGSSRWLITAFLFLTMAACGGPAGPKAPSGASLVEWTGEDKELFADGIDLNGLDNTGDPPPDEENEARIPDRVKRADGVVLAHVIGITREPAGDRHRYRLELAVEGAPLSGQPPEAPFVLVVDPFDAAFGSIRAAEPQIVGRRVVVFYKLYVDQEQQRVVRFHLSPPTESVTDKIKRAATVHQFE